MREEEKHENIWKTCLIIHLILVSHPVVDAVARSVSRHRMHSHNFSLENDFFLSFPFVVGKMSFPVRKAAVYRHVNHPF
jgi:hypothetical protein